MMKVSEFFKTEDEKTEMMSSPFAALKDECLLKEDISLKFGRYIELSRLQQEIIKAVNHMLVADQRLIKRYLYKQGVRVEHSSLTKELYNLFENEYLARYKFCTGEGRIIYQIFRTGRKGKGWLKRVGIEIRMEGYLNQRTPSEIKKLLSANQAMLALQDQGIYRLETAKTVVIQPKFRTATRLFRAYGLLINDESAIIVQPVRSGESKFDLLEKLSRIDTTIKRSEKANQIFPEDVTILIVAEDSCSMNEYKEFLSTRTYTSFKLAVSNDLQMDSKSNQLESFDFIDVRPWWKRLAV